MSVPAQFQSLSSRLWIWDLGLGFGTWIWDLDLGLDLGLTIVHVVHGRISGGKVCLSFDIR